VRLMDLIITSAWRPKIQKTINVLPKSWRKWIYLLIPKDQYKVYKSHVPGWVNIITHDRNGLSETRQWVLDNAKSFSNHVVMLDDDLDFHIRIGASLVKATPYQVNDMLHLLGDWMVNYKLIHVGVSARAGNNHITSDYAEITRAMCVHGLNLKKINAINAKFNRVPCMQDFDMTLQLLEHGYPNRVSYKYAHGQSGSNTKGGCSVYRTPEMLKKTAFEMARLHPGIVKPKIKHSVKGWGGEFGKERVDVIVYWKKAFTGMIKKTRAKEGISNFLEN